MRDAQRKVSIAEPRVGMGLVTKPHLRAEIRTSLPPAPEWFKHGFDLVRIKPRILNISKLCFTLYLELLRITIFEPLHAVVVHLNRPLELRPSELRRRFPVQVHAPTRNLDHDHFGL